MLVMEEYHTKVVCMHKQNSEEVPFPGHLTSKSNVCSFRVVLLELMIGRRSMDKSRSAGYYAPALGFLMFAVGVNSSAKDLIETIKRPDAIAAGYIRQFVKLVTVDDPFITTDYMVSGGSTGSWPGSPSRNVGKIDEASELRRTVSDIKHNVQTQLSENAKTNKRVIGIHKELQKLHREAIQNTINSVTMVATLIASIAFVVIFNLPGQYFQDVNSGGDIGEAQTTMIVSEAVVVDTRRTGRTKHLPSRGRALSKQPATKAFAGAAGGVQRRGNQEGYCC
uniref:PGG domain-containing protein n=2 Tax=Zea mays TaxID=4577 RepID=A0A804QH58_MAIZE